ncbi:MAG TPA: ergothioneine biosynthesis protein EgtB [Candidatus Cybelea sp.]|nr:ergothioneine biosynthesis protein EgtB [Candidatus Cybelea sp.]
MQVSPEPTTAGAARENLARRFKHIRDATVALTEGLEPEDLVIQSMPDASPTKWHLAHTTWFFETFILTAHAPGYDVFDPTFGYLFNSYYEAVGARHPRAERGLLSRPTTRRIIDYRAHVDAAATMWLERASDNAFAAARDVFVLGLHHEQQHQELIVTDLKHALARHPEMPVYRTDVARPSAAAAPLTWSEHEGGVREIGHDGAGFAFDNEGPRHKAYVAPFRIANRLVTCGEYAAFIDDDGYRRPEFWHSEGWAAVQARGWTAPLYWRGRDIITLSGARARDAAEPVCHVSWYEASAFAKWAKARLPTEAEWEVAAGDVPVAGNLLDAGHWHPVPAASAAARQIYGDVWEWTASPYVPYPGFREPPGAIGEYNGKFMASQMVLRGGSCATPEGHIRPTYRNFFYPDARWQFSGIRLASDL